jgi:hypothetical protein
MIGNALNLVDHAHDYDGGCEDMLAMGLLKANIMSAAQREDEDPLWERRFSRAPSGLSYKIKWYQTRMDIDHLQHGFTYLLLERVAPEQNANRFYHLAWQPSLFADGAVVSGYGSKDGHRRTLAPLPSPSLAEAWPLIRAILRRRLRHGYKMIEPKNIAEAR